MKKCVINYVTSNAWYPAGQRRLVESLGDMRFDGDIIVLSDKEFKDCSSNSNIPYAFKVFAIQEAKNRCYALILWMDSSFWAIKPLDNIFKLLENEGCIMQAAGEWLGHWCSDITLERFGSSRQEAFKIPMYSAELTGLNMRNENAVK